MGCGLASSERCDVAGWKLGDLPPPCSQQQGALACVFYCSCFLVCLYIRMDVTYWMACTFIRCAHSEFWHGWGLMEEASRTKNHSMHTVLVSLLQFQAFLFFLFWSWAAMPCRRLRFCEWAINCSAITRRCLQHGASSKHRVRSGPGCSFCSVAFSSATSPHSRNFLYS